MTTDADTQLPQNALVSEFEELAGDSGVLLIEGPHYTAKTTLLTAISERSSASGARVLEATGWPGEHLSSYGVLAQLLRKADGAGKLTTHPWLGTLAYHYLYRSLVELATQRPLLLAVDDINHADQASQDVLRFLARRLKGTHIRLVLTYRTGQAVSYCDDFVKDILRLPYTRVVRVRLLSLEEVTDHVRQVTAGLDDRRTDTPTSEIGGELYTISGGNITLVQLLLTEYLDAAARGRAELTVSANFHETVRAQVKGVELPGFTHGARAAAVLGRLCSPHRLSRLLDGDRFQADRVLRALQELGMTDGGHLRKHLGKALIDDPAFIERADLHLSAARVLFDDGVAVEHVAAHLTAAGRLRAPWDLPLVMELVGRTREEGNHEAAKALLRVAQSSATTTAERSAVDMLLLRAEWLTNPALAASLMPPLVAAARRGALQVSDMAFLTRALTLHGFSDRAGELMDMIRDVPPQADDWAEVLLARILYCVWHGVPRQQAQLGFRSTEESRAFAVSSQVPWLPTALHKIPDLLRQSDPAGATFVAEQIFETIRVKSSGPEPFLVASMLLLSTNSLSMAQEWCTRLSHSLDAYPSPVWQALLSYVQALVSFQLGDLGAAHRLLGEALAHKPWEEWGGHVAFLAAVQVDTFTEMGRHEEAAEVLDRPVPPSSLQGFGRLFYSLARGRHHMAMGRVHAAVAEFENCRHMQTCQETRFLLFSSWQSALAEAYLRSGRVDEAREILLEYEGRLLGEEVPARGVALRLLAKTSEPDQRIRLLKSSADALEHTNSWLQLAYTLAELASAYRETTQLRLARTTMRRAQRLAQQCKAGMLQELITMDATSEGTQRESTREHHEEFAALSSAEQRVALLAVQGHTNREISKRLFITPSTVEQHLTRIYRKLRVRHREDLEDKFSLALMNVVSHT
ncbi:LuxR C-terminal-related transcriptional regulator [Streptomyces sp. NPDC051677]|uniref:helix-turn-helix transcriptional regulator n=1 Tax=Streptomyces sp. NPDC051677 TaxID=3365669 RepID=UPI0037D544AB